MTGPWTLVEKVVCFEIMDGDRLVARIDRPCRVGDDAKVTKDAKLISTAPAIAKALAEFVRVVKPDALLMIDPELGDAVLAAERALAEANWETADTAERITNG